MFRQKIKTILMQFSGLLISFIILEFLASIGLVDFRVSYQAEAVTKSQESIYSQNNILFYDATDDCVIGGSQVMSDSGSNPNGDSYKINADTKPGTADQGGFWYYEEKWISYSAGINTAIMHNNAELVRRETKIDSSFENMPYIYADNFDIDFPEGQYPIMRSNGGTSTRKYYWLVLPNEAYAVHTGDKYIATFEKSSEPIYFIIFDVWACEHQGNAFGPWPDYCSMARANPNDVGIGVHSLGQLSNDGWAANNALGERLGRLTCLHRITTIGETIANESATCGSLPTSSSSSGSSGTSGSSSAGTVAEGVTTTTYKGHTIAFPIAGVSKATKNQVSTLPCNHSIGCHYGPGNPPGNAAAAWDLCMGDNCKNQPVVSITDGVITRDIQTTRNGAACNHVRIRSDIDGTVIAYMHLTSENLNLKAGDRVRAGQLIGHIDWGSGASGAGPCNDNSVAHVHIDKGKSTTADGGPQEGDRDPEIVKMVDAAWQALPDSGTAGNNGGAGSSSVNCVSPTISGDVGAIKSAKNANESVFDVGQYSDWGANWDDNNKDRIKHILETYGDLAYQAGKASGVPWQAIIVQMRYEDSGSVCGKNNFWGIDCPDKTTRGNGSNFDNLGEGFVGYVDYVNGVCNAARNVTDKDACRNSLKTSDPLQFLKNIGPLWVQGDATGPGYAWINGMASSLKKLDAFLATNEGKAIVAKFGNYSGDTGAGMGSVKIDYPQINQQTGYTCGPASMAMLSSAATGQTISESDIISVVGSDRAYANTRDGIVDLDKKVGEKYGFEVEGVAVNEANRQSVADKMREYLNKGYMIHFSGEGCTISSTCNSHYVGIFSLDGDTAYIADSSGAPASNREVNLDKYITGREINPKNGSTGGGFHGGYFSAIKGKNAGTTGTICVNSGGNNNGLNECDNGSGSSNTSSDSSGSSTTDTTVNEDTGLTFEQAKQFAKQFGKIGNAGAEVVAAATWCYTTSGQHVCNTCKGGPGSDCTAVPYFFAGALTDLNFNSQMTQAGNFAASDIASRANVSKGTTPKVWSVVSAVGVHTWMIVGHHNGKWITVESSCSDNGNGEGTGEYGGGGVAWAAEIPDNAATTSVFSNMIPKEYAYLEGHIDLNKVSSFISGGYSAIK